MGSSTSNYAFTINVDRPDGVYYTGEVVSGNVQLLIEGDQVQIGRIGLTLTGEVGYTTRHGMGNDTHTDYHHNPFFETSLVLIHPQVDWETVTFNRGKHVFPFQMEIPNGLPPSVSDPEAYPHSRYGLHLGTAAESSFLRNRKSRFLTVMTYVSLMQNPQLSQSTRFGGQNRQNIMVRGTLNKTGFVLGECIQGTLEFQNPGRALIKQLNYVIVENYQLAQKEKSYTVLKGVLENFAQRDDAELSTSFSFLIPTVGILPTFHFEGGVKEPTQVHVSHLLKFIVRSAEVFADVEMTIPLVIATQ